MSSTILQAFTDVIGFYFQTLSSFLMSEPIIYFVVLAILIVITNMLLFFMRNSRKGGFY